ncbi:ABC transporter permease [Pedobacter frigoris]|uniref:FtsX-like permease family protein n=1 Tax=Pedobacter frigoris TaxID=2571272 RepID=A0A4U1CMQ3_9SPHI|nr:ABC transporter permease [Pedobacter frigoris]TKC08693.1 FtsX-like permease family protein [Pedobacter frigoris]
MIRHLFKLTWNKKKKHIFLIVELFFFFLATGFIALFLYETGVLKQKRPTFNIENLISIDYRFMYTGDTTFSYLTEELKQIKEINQISIASYIPYSPVTNPRSVTYKKKKTDVAAVNVDDKYLKILGLKLKSGRWIEKKDYHLSTKVAVIDAGTKQKLFPDHEAIGRIINISGIPHQVIGVVENLNDPSVGSNYNQNVFTHDPQGAASVLLKLKTPMNEDIYKKVKQTTDRFMHRDNIMPVSQYKEKHEKEQFIPLLILSLLSGFLVINIILGLFSILYQNINTRRSEIGLRRAAGATSADIYRQIMMEMFLIATLALIPCLIVGYQFMAFNVLNATTGGYICAMVSGSVTIYLLVIICALYPARMASKIHPAEALHDD